MGDRGNIEIQQSSGADSVYLYTHWGGSEVDQVLAGALEKGRSRWSDPSYLTRIIFNELQGDNRDLTGFGIAVRTPDDNEHPIPRVYWDGRTSTPRVDIGERSFTAEEFIVWALAGRAAS